MPLAIGIGSALGGLFGGLGSIFGGNAEANAAKQAAQLQWQEFEALQKDLQPYMQAGQTGLTDLFSALQALQGGFSPDTFLSSPQFKFQEQQGDQGIIDNRTALGGVGGGNTLKAISDYNQSLASTYYQNYFNDWLNQNKTLIGGYSDIAGLGESAAAGVGSAGMSAATNAGNALESGASAQAGMYSGLANAGSGAINNYLLMSLLGGGGGGGGSAFNAFAPAG